MNKLLLLLFFIPSIVRKCTKYSFFGIINFVTEMFKFSLEIWVYVISKSTECKLM